MVYAVLWIPIKCTAIYYIHTQYILLVHLRKNEFFCKTILACLSGAQMASIHEKNGKNLVTLPLEVCQFPFPKVDSGIQASPKKESGTSAGEVALGHVLAVPGQLLTTTAPPAVIPAAKRTYAEAAATPALDGATLIYVQRGGVGPPLADNYAGLYLVLEKGPKVFKLQLGTQQEVVSQDRLKPHAGQAPPAAAEPPRRGCPPQGAN